MTRKWMTLVWAAAVAVGLSAAQVMAEPTPTTAEPPKPTTEPAQTTPTPDPNSPLKTQQDKVSYSLGMSMANGLKKDKVEVNVDLLLQGMRDTLTGGKMLITDEEMKSTLTAFSAEAAQKAAAGNLAAGEAFLAKNKTEPGVVTLPSGLQYKVLQAGTGKKPTAESMVECNYRGTLIDGTEFDSSSKRGQPATLKVSQIIPGWKEALLLMPVGSKWQLFVPAKLGYGPQGTPGGPIGPNSTLIFEIELLAIKESPKIPAPQKPTN